MRESGGGWGLGNMGLRYQIVVDDARGKMPSGGDVIDETRKVGPI